MCDVWVAVCQPLVKRRCMYDGDDDDNLSVECCCRRNVVDGNRGHAVTKVQPSDLTRRTWTVSCLDEPESYAKTEEQVCDTPPQGES